MVLLHKIKPKFWDHHEVAEGSHAKLFTFRRKWKLLVVLTTLVAVIPLIFMTVFTLREAYHAVQAEILIQTRQQVAATAHTVPHLLTNYESGMDQASLAQLFDDLELGDGGEAFIIDDSGILQTPSRFHGEFQGPVALPMALDPFTGEADRAHVRTFSDTTGRPMLLGHAYIPGTPLNLIVIKNPAEPMESYRRIRLKLISFAGVSIVLILAGILGMATYMVHRIHEADGKRTEAIRRMAYANKMASIGRLSAGVAHELNNPLEIINTKAGLIQDMFTYFPHYAEDPKLNGLVTDIQSNIQRCGQITHRLLNLASGSRHRIETINIGNITTETLAFLKQDATYRNITIHSDICPQLPPVTCDRGNLQQILLNLFNNALQAMKTGGRLDVSVTSVNSDDQVQIEVANDGPPMPEKDITHIFDPFYFSQTDEDGAGLGLSVTYGLVRQMGAHIRARSKAGEGTRFTITLPLSAGQAAN